MIDRETLKKVAGAVGSGALIGSIVAGAATLSEKADPGIGDAIQSNVNTVATMTTAVADRLVGGDDAIILSGTAAATPVSDDDVNASTGEDTEESFQGCGVGTVNLE